MFVTVTLAPTGVMHEIEFSASRVIRMVSSLLLYVELINCILEEMFTPFMYV